MFSIGSMYLWYCWQAYYFTKVSVKVKLTNLELIHAQKVSDYTQKSSVAFQHLVSGLSNQLLAWIFWVPVWALLLTPAFSWALVKCLLSDFHFQIAVKQSCQESQPTSHIERWHHLFVADLLVLPHSVPTRWLTMIVFQFSSIQSIYKSTDSLEKSCQGTL